MRLKSLSLIAVLVFSLCTYAADDKDTLTKLGDQVPKFSIKTLDGQTLTPESLKGKVVLLNFFATWCGPCQAEMPELQKLQGKYKDNKDFMLVSVGREHKDDEVKAFAEKNKLTFTFAADPTRETYKLFATQYIPRNYLIDPSGKIVFQSMGFSPDEFEKLTQTIEKTLAK